MQISPTAVNLHLPENLTGIDLDKGLRICNGSINLYLNMLQKFRESRRNECDEIRALLAAGESEAAVRKAHSMKSVGGTIGASDLSEAFRLLEAAISANIDDQIEERLNNCARSLGIVVSSLDTVFGNAIKPPEITVKSVPIGLGWRGEVMPDKPRHTILIVDDTPENIMVLMELLRSEYTIIVATNGERALQLAGGASPPDLILLDILMPDLSGYEVCVRLKKDPRTVGIPVIFVTGLTEESDEQKGLDLGAVDYIQKPFSPSLVRARVRNHLELKIHRDNLELVVQERTRELILTQDAAIVGLGILAEYRDIETGEHIRRTQDFVRLIAEKLKDHPRFHGYFDSVTMRLLFNSAPLHDIGKVGVPDCVLQKPGRLTASEFESMKLHTIFGRDVINRIEKNMHDHSASAFLRFAEELAHTHHEHWDGTGYHGMKGDEIPISGRLMALADIYDALTSVRVYKPAYNHDEAVKIITEGDGRTLPEHFDPVVLQAFLDLSEKFRQASSGGDEK